MSKDLTEFNKWAKNVKFTRNENGNECVVYTRVSSKEQFESNLSLDWQKRIIDEFADRVKYNIAEYFGGVYESAKTDGRKEFQRMLTYVKRNKKIRYILVYLLDRFSRTGGGAIKLAKDLREQYGITIIAVTQPIDTSNPGGIFQQNLQFLFGEYDNSLRSQRTTEGMTEKMRRGIWCLQPPVGYDIVYEREGDKEERRKGERKIVINETGKKLRQAFVWKAQGMKSEAIIDKLKAMGVKMYKQKLSHVFDNPFYCGLLSSTLLKGKLIEGNHEKLISKELFLKVNNIRRSSAAQMGVPHKKELPQLPLKVFMKCDKCGQPYTGYVVKAKKIWYYKCRTNGCHNNRNATDVNNLFEGMLSNYQINDETAILLKSKMKRHYNSIIKSQQTEETTLKHHYTQIDNKINVLEEDYYVNKTIPALTFEKLMKKLDEERRNIQMSMDNLLKSSSNLEKMINDTIEFCSKLSTIWRFSDFSEKEKLQKLVFPEGIVFENKNSKFQTTKINQAIFEYAQLQSVLEDTKKEQRNNNAALSNQVIPLGLEPRAHTLKVYCSTN